MSTPSSRLTVLSTASPLHSPPTVSVCIPAYRGRFLARAISSVLCQTRVVEVVVVDDCSPDDLRTIVDAFSDARLRYTRNPVNLGVPHNYNHALSRARGDYVMIFCDHDVMAPAFIERCAALLDSDPAVVLAFSAVRAIGSDDAEIVAYPRHLFPAITPGLRLAHHLVTRPAAPLSLDTLIRRSALEGLDPWFDPQYWWYADIALWLRLCSRGKIGYVDEYLLDRRERERGHPLENREWESMVVCERIRRDLWHLAFPRGGPRSLFWRLIYTIRRDRDALLLLLSRLAHCVEARYDLPPEASTCLSPIARLVAAALLAVLDPPSARVLRTARRHLRAVCPSRSAGPTRL